MEMQLGDGAPKRVNRMTGQTRLALKIWLKENREAAMRMSYSEIAVTAGRALSARFKRWDARTAWEDCGFPPKRDAEVRARDDEIAELSSRFSDIAERLAGAAVLYAMIEARLKDE